MKALDWHRDELVRLLASKDALPHALLLRGPRGIGKLVFARALAQGLLCESPAPDGTACGHCGACGWFDVGTHPDYRQIEPGSDEEEPEEGAKKATVISVAQVRALADLVNVSSHRRGPKVVVLHPAEALNVNAANALLKSLEEPPPRTHFIVVTHRPHQLLPTIKSRCRQLALATPSADAAAAWLTKQGMRSADVALAHTGGAPLLALELGENDYWAARAAFLRELALHKSKPLVAAEAVRDIPIPHVISWLQKWSYDIARFHALGDVRYNPDAAAAIAEAAREIAPLAVLRFHREMVKLQPVAQHPLNPRLFLEELLLSYSGLFMREREPA